MPPLSEILRPSQLDEVIGQEHLTVGDGIYRKMMENNQYMSTILYGNPGTGKSSIARILSKNFKYHFSFNASSDSKQTLKEFIDAAYYDTVFLIVDEIHCMKKDTQDYLLPFIENGKIIIIGLTTETPYYCVNKAILSRCIIFKLNDLTDEQIYLTLQKVVREKLDLPYKISDDVLKKMSLLSNNELRSAFNLLELLMLKFTNTDREILTTNDLISIPQFKNYKLDYRENNYFDLLSALQKCIRGSDVNSSLHYLARLLIINDLKMICRRLLVIVYEDIGLSNSNLALKVKAACDTVLELGMPEARIVLSNIVIELCLSPKSNTSYLAIDAALEDLKNTSDLDIPKNILNREINGKDIIYKYPHDFKNSIVKQEYAPLGIKNKVYYHPKEESHYEKVLKERYEMIENFLKK